jgi:hypothetical protein
MAWSLLTSDVFQSYIVQTPNRQITWDRDAWAAAPYGRNLYGVPPQGRADNVFRNLGFHGTDK